jgi:gamma-glutamyltranspeptidase/glutathione hydrolase
MLDAGGNAADAAVAAAFTLAVVEPSMSGLGGRAQILLRTPDGALHGIDGTTQAPASYDPDTAPQADHGYPVIGVPGVPAALLRAHAEFGTLPLAQVMAPAIRHADEGFELLPGEARRHAAAAEELAAFPGSRAVFLQEDGTTRPAGARFRQPELATTLRAIAEGGADAFYRGEIARRIVDDVQANGGVLTLASLAEYRAETSTVLRDDYRGYETVGLAVPSFGAITLEILNLLEPFDLAAFSEARWAAVFAEAVRVAYLDRGEQYTAGDRARLISDAYAAERLDALRLPEGVRPAAAADAGAAPAPRLDGAGPAGRAVVAGARSAPLPARAEGGPATPPPPAWTEEVGHTTHLTAADGDGMVVALTQSLGPSLGSKVVTPGLGFVYASTLGGYLGRMEPGERAASHISPFLLLRDGQPVLGLGAAGGGRIIPAVVAVTSRIVDRGMSLEEALRAPRLYPATGSAFADPSPDAVVPVDVEVETGAGFSAAHLDSLTAFGFQVDPEPRSGRFGRVHAVYRPDPGAPWVGGADPDWEGSVATSPPGSGS